MCITNSRKFNGETQTPMALGNCKAEDPKKCHCYF